MQCCQQTYGSCSPIHFQVLIKGSSQCLRKADDIQIAEKVLSSAIAARLKSMYVAGLRLLSYLDKITPAQQIDQHLRLIACAASFTDQRESWSSPEASEQSRLILNHILGTEEQRGSQELKDILADLLQLHVKPAFAKSKIEAITQQGRKVIDPMPTRVVPSEPEEEMKPWKLKKVYVIAVYGWVLSQLEVTSPHDMFISGITADGLLEDLTGRELASSDPSFTCYA